MFEPNLLGANFYVWNRQVFGLYRLNYKIYHTFGIYLKFCLYKIPVYLWFSLERIHYISPITNDVVGSTLAQVEVSNIMW
jgi:hypothetical protein